MQPRSQRVPPGVDNGDTGRRADGADATATKPGCGEPSGARPILTAITAAAARHAHREARPRWALNVPSGLAVWGGGRLFFNASTAIVPARMTVSRANAHIARVICRYQAVQLRISYVSTPP